MGAYLSEPKVEYVSDDGEAVKARFYFVPTLYVKEWNKNPQQTGYCYADKAYCLAQPISETLGPLVVPKIMIPELRRIPSAGRQSETR